MLFEYIPCVLKYIAIVGAATSFFAATTGLLQNDLKRVIAYSTCSQLLRPYRFSINQSRFVGCGWQPYTTGYISALLLNEVAVIGLMNS